MYSFLGMNLRISPLCLSTLLLLQEVDG